MRGRFILSALFLAGCLILCPGSSRAAEHGGGEGGEGGEKAAEAATGPQFVSVGPLSVPILRDGKTIQTLLLVAALEVDGGDHKKQVEAYLPLLKDAYLSSLYGSLHATGAGPTRLVDVSYIRTRLEGANAKVLPPGLVTNVLLQQVEQR